MGKDGPGLATTGEIKRVLTLYPRYCITYLPVTYFFSHKINCGKKVPVMVWSDSCRGAGEQVLEGRKDIMKILTLLLQVSQ